MPAKLTARPKYTEAEFLAQVLEYAKLRGWRTAHFRPAMLKKGGWVTPVQGDGKGFPDLLMVRKGSMIVAELKRSKKEKLTPEQEQWLAEFSQSAVEAYHWTPDDWPEIERVLE